MKRTLFCFLILPLMCALSSSGARPLSNSADEKILSIEKQLWEAWTKNDGKTFDENLSRDYVFADANGVLNRTATIKMISTDNCGEKTFSEDNEKIVWLDRTTALLTSKAHLHFSCNGQRQSENIVCSSVYVKRRGRWWHAFHQESVAPPMTEAH
jgi:hypothetical protein